MPIRRFRGTFQLGTRASRSSISMALAEWSSSLSAALTLVDAGVLESTMIFSSGDSGAESPAGVGPSIRDRLPSRLPVGGLEFGHLKTAT